MGSQHRITTQTDLLDDKGHLVEPGYATDLLWNYDRSKIKAGWHRIKEWDYYYILNQDFGITFTMSDLGYTGMHAVAWLDFKNKTTTQVDTLVLFPKGKTNFPSTSSAGDVNFTDKKLDISFHVQDNTRLIKISCPSFENKRGEKGLKGELVLSQEPKMESMVIATSWKENPKKFYYNQKINCMRAEGKITIGDHLYEFTPETSFAGLDWGRGNWTYKNRWYWGSASGKLNGELFGWNIGYGFSDRSPATENMLFYKGKAHKLDEVTFDIDTSDYMKPWKFTSNDSRFELNFTPAVDRYSKTDLLLIKSEQHQVFGYFSGKVILDDGTPLEITNFLGFAEDVLNWW